MALRIVWTCAREHGFACKYVYLWMRACACARARACMYFLGVSACMLATCTCDRLPLRVAVRCQMQKIGRPHSVESQGQARQACMCMASMTMRQTFGGHINRQSSYASTGSSLRQPMGRCRCNITLVSTHAHGSTDAQQDSSVSACKHTCFARSMRYRHCTNCC